MSAQQPQHPPVRLLIAERSENAAHQFDSLLRDAGIATRLEIIDLPMALDKLAQADLMLCNAALPQLVQLLPTLASNAPQVPIIVVNNDEGSLTQSEAMELGAADVVSDTEGRHLVLVVQRELEHVCQNIQFKQALKSLNEAEQRCRLLLQSSRAAIAYVHEGMHIYANEGYLKLFGFEDSDDLLGLPLIDLLDRDSADALKAILKQFRDNEDEIDLDFSGTSTDGATISGNMALAAAEYEGEHCLQVTVRTSSATSDTAVDTAAEDSATEKDADAEVPVLREDAIVGNDDPTVGQANGASTDTASAAQAVSNGADAGPESDVEEGPDNTGSSFTLELMEEPADQSGEEPATAETTDPAIEAAQSPAEEPPPEEPLPEESLPEESQQAAPTAEAIDFTNEPLEQADEAEAPVLIEESAEPTTESPTETAAETAQPRRTNRAAAHGLSEFLSQSEASVGEQKGQFTSIFVAQIDSYDDLQRTHGLAGAENVCSQIEAELLSDVDGPFMQISRYQWAMLVCDQTRDDALSKADCYRSSIESMMFEVREKTVRPTITLGGAILNMEGYNSLGTALEATLNSAFATLKTTLASAEENTVKLPKFETAEQENDDEANRVLSLISEAIENQSFILLFQPIISLRGDSDEHYEVFLRMIDRNGEQMAPGRFLSTAIDNGVAGKIDRWVILQSIKMLSTHRSKGHNTRLTINLTSNSVADPEFIQWLGVAIKAARLPSDAVIFQITERDASTYIRQTREFVEGLKNLHCRASLSRFGLAGEPFETLSHIPVDFVKLDGSLIADLNKNPELKHNIADMVRELQSAGKLTIVPMVESASVLSTLWQSGVNYIQGHYLQEPTSDMDYDFSTDD